MGLVFSHSHTKEKNSCLRIPRKSLGLFLLNLIRSCVYTRTNYCDQGECILRFKPIPGLKLKIGVGSVSLKVI